MMTRHHAAQGRFKFGREEIRMNIGEFCSALFGGRLGFADIGDLLADFYNAFSVRGGIAPIVNFIESAFRDGASVMPAVLFIASLFLCIFGQRIFSVFRFSVFFAAGYLLGVYFLAPSVCAVIPSMTEAVIGVAVAVVCGVFSKLIYHVAYPILLVGFACVLAGNTLSLGVAGAIVASVIILVVGFLLRRYAEMLVTALFGAWGMCEAIRMYWDFSASAADPWLPILIVTLSIAAVGAFVQFKTRERRFL